MFPDLIDGVVVDEKQEYRVLCRTPASLGDPADLRAQELIDGVPIWSFQYENRWIHVAQFGFLETCDVALGSWKQREQVSVTLQQEYLQHFEPLSRKLDPSQAYCFTLLSAYHRFVVGYRASLRLLLTGCQRLSDLTPVDVFDVARHIGCETPKVHAQSVESEVAMKALVSTLNPFLCKGYMWKSKQYLAPQYVSIALVSDLSTLGRLYLLGELERPTWLRLLRYNRWTSFLDAFPRWSTLCLPMVTVSRELVNLIQTQYDSVRAVS